MAALFIYLFIYLFLWGGGDEGGGGGWCRNPDNFIFSKFGIYFSLIFLTESAYLTKLPLQSNRK